MANGTNKGGAKRGDAVTIRETTCFVCGKAVSYRKSQAHSRGGRYCKVHGDDQTVLMVMAFRNKRAVKVAA